MYRTCAEFRASKIGSNKGTRAEYTGRHSTPSRDIEPGNASRLALAEEATRALGMVVWPMDRYECDDALATGAARFRDRVDQVRILSPDKDLGQCIVGDRVVVAICFLRLRALCGKSQPLDEAQADSLLGAVSAAAIGSVRCAPAVTAVRRAGFSAIHRAVRRYGVTTVNRRGVSAIGRARVTSVESARAWAAHMPGRF